MMVDASVHPICIASPPVAWRSERSCAALYCLSSSSQIIMTTVNFFLTLWLMYQGGGGSVQLQRKSLVEAGWLKDCTAGQRLAPETSWSVSTSPCQSGDCDTLQNQCYQSCPDNHQDLICHWKILMLHFYRHQGGNKTKTKSISFSSAYFWSTENETITLGVSSGFELFEAFFPPTFGLISVDLRLLFFLYGQHKVFWGMNCRFVPSVWPTNVFFWCFLSLTPLFLPFSPFISRVKPNKQYHPVNIALT